jgi:hypothetical protein
MTQMPRCAPVCPGVPRAHPQRDPDGCARVPRPLKGGTPGHGRGGHSGRSDRGLVCPAPRGTRSAGRR